MRLFDGAGDFVGDFTPAGEGSGLGCLIGPLIVVAIVVAPFFYGFAAINHARLEATPGFHHWETTTSQWLDPGLIDKLPAPVAANPRWKAIAGEGSCMIVVTYGDSFFQNRQQYEDVIRFIAAETIADGYTDLSGEVDPRILGSRLSMAGILGDTWEGNNQRAVENLFVKMYFEDANANRLHRHWREVERSVTIQVGEGGAISDSSQWRISAVLDDEYVRAFAVDKNLVLSGRVLAVFNQNTYAGFKNTEYETDLRNHTQIRAVVFEVTSAGWYPVGHPAVHAK